MRTFGSATLVGFFFLKFGLLYQSGAVIGCLLEINVRLAVAVRYQSSVIEVFIVKTWGGVESGG